MGESIEFQRDKTGKTVPCGVKERGRRQKEIVEFEVSMWGARREEEKEVTCGEAERKKRVSM